VLRHVLYDRVPLFARPLLARLRSWSTPRIDALHQDDPNLLPAPEKYLHAPPAPSADLADLVREHRRALEDLVSGLSARNGTISTQLEEELDALADDPRLIQVETVLQHSPFDRLPAAVRSLAGRLESWTKPRIGVLSHHEPRPFVVPETYAHATPPQPAPAISIVTPSYAQGAFLERTLQSVINQNYPGLEYVVQDGGSADASVEILRRLGPLLTDWRSERDDGQADAINRGFERTSGEIMAWLNSDDLLLPGALSYVARYFAEHPDVDVVYGNRVMIDEHDREIGVWILPEHDDHALTLADFVPQETLFWRRRIWEAVGGRVDATFKFALDWDLLLRFRAAGAKIVRLPRFLGAFRVHAQQKTTVDHWVGLEECDELRRRVHGRVLPLDEIGRQLRPYLARQVLVHTRHMSLDLLRSGQTIAVEPWLLKRQAYSGPELSDVETGEAVLSSPLVSLEAPSGSARAAAGEADERETGRDRAQVRSGEAANVRPVELDPAAARRRP
jgi:hypothetical protein